MVYISKYIKKQNTVEAVQWTGLDSIKEVVCLLDLCTFTLEPDLKNGGFTLLIKTDSDSGPLVVNKNDFVILTDKSVYTVSAEKFLEDYEPYPSAYIKTQDYAGRIGSGSITVTSGVFPRPQYTENN